MQLIPVYLYPNKIDVYTNVPGTTERYRRVYNRNIKFYRGIDNTVDIHVRNSDEKSLDVTGFNFVFNLINRNDQSLILSKDCTIVTAATGRLRVSLTELEMYSIQNGFYEYSIHKETRQTNNDSYVVIKRDPMYIDSQYGAVATLEVVGDTRGNPLPSLEVTSFTETRPSVTGDTGDPFYISSLIDAKYNTSTAHSNHTFVFYFNNYTGSVVLQGSLSDSNDPTNLPWTTIDTLPYVSANIEYYNTVGKWRWFRIKQKSHQGVTAVFVVEQTTLGNYLVDLDDGGTLYTVGDLIVIPGSKLGGRDGENNLTITVTSVNINGRIDRHGFSFVGTSAVGFRTYVLNGSNPSAVGRLDKILYR